MIKRGMLSLAIPISVALGVAHAAQAGIWNSAQTSASASVLLTQEYIDFASGTDLLRNGGLDIPIANAATVLPIVNRGDSISLAYPGGSLSAFGRVNASVAGDILSVELETRTTLGGTPDLASFEGDVVTHAESSFAIFGLLQPFTRVEFSLVTFAQAVSGVGARWAISAEGGGGFVNTGDFSWASDAGPVGIGSSGTLVNTTGVHLPFSVNVSASAADFVSVLPGGFVDVFEVGTSTGNLSFGLRAIESPVPSPCTGALVLASTALRLGGRRRR